MHISDILGFTPQPQHMRPYLIVGAVVRNGIEHQVKVKGREIGVFWADVHVARVMVVQIVHRTGPVVVQVREGDPIFGSQLVPNDDFVNVIELVPIIVHFVHIAISAEATSTKSKYQIKTQGSSYGAPVSGVEGEKKEEKKEKKTNDAHENSEARLHPNVLLPPPSHVATASTANKVKKNATQTYKGSNLGPPGMAMFNALAVKNDLGSNK
jgi:hypothetical protein